MIDYKKFEGCTFGPLVFDPIHLTIKGETTHGDPWEVGRIWPGDRWKGYGELFAAAPDLLAENKRLRQLIAALLPENQDPAFEAEGTVSLSAVNAARAFLNEQK